MDNSVENNINYSIKKTFTEKWAAFMLMSEEKQEAKVLKDLRNLFDYCREKQLKERYIIK
jgi:hypothetical protein